MHGLTPGPLPFDTVQHAAAHMCRELLRDGAVRRVPKAGQIAPLAQPPARFTRVLRGSVDLQTAVWPFTAFDGTVDGPLGSQAQPRPGRFARCLPPAEGRPRTRPANGRAATAAFSPPAQSAPALSAGGPSLFSGLCMLLALVSIPSSELVSHAFGTGGHPQKHEPLSSTRCRSVRGLGGDDGAGRRATEFQSGPCQSQPLPRRNDHRCGFQPPHGWSTPRLPGPWFGVACPSVIISLSSPRQNQLKHCVSTRLTVVLNEFASASRDPFANRSCPGAELTSVFNRQQNYLHT
jgi:hypothetical protein